MNAEKLAEIQRKARLFDWLSSKGSFNVSAPYEDDELYAFFQELGPVNDRETEKTGEGRDLAAAVESAIEAEKKRRSVVSALEIADALHSACPRERYVIPVTATYASKHDPRPLVSQFVVTVEANDRADALKQVRDGYPEQAVRLFVPAEAKITFDARRLRRAE